MDDTDFEPAPRASGGSAFSTIVALAYGVLMLGFLIAIDHADWFQIRPASGTANAMSLASTRG